MGKPRTIRVTIVGEVKKQGTYTISAFNSALNALFRAGGLTDYGNLRKIEIRRAGQTVDILDLYESKLVGLLDKYEEETTSTTQQSTGFSRAIKNRTRETFAETFRKIRSYMGATKMANSSTDLIMILLGENLT